MTHTRATKAAVRAAERIGRLTNGLYVNDIVHIIDHETGLPELVTALKQAGPMAQTLMDELAKTKATDWGLVNDCLCAVSRAIAIAEKGHTLTPRRSDAR